MTPRASRSTSWPDCRRSSRRAGATRASTVDPHVWLDPSCTRDWSTRCASALAEAAPSDASTFRANGDAFTREIDRLARRRYGRAWRHAIEPLLVTNHAAFGYLAAGVRTDAGGDQRPRLPTPSRARSGWPSSKSWSSAKGSRPIFTEDLVSPKVAETLAEEAGVRTAVLHTIEGLTDEEVAAGDDYVRRCGRTSPRCGGRLAAPDRLCGARASREARCSRPAGSRSRTGGRRSSSTSISASSPGSSSRSSVRTAPASRRS